MGAYGGGISGGSMDSNFGGQSVGSYTPAPGYGQSAPGVGSPLGGHGDPMGAIAGILGPGGLGGANTAFTYDPYTRSLTKIGTPSLAGGMMRTVAGATSPNYGAAHYGNLQRSISREANERNRTERAVAAQINARSKANPHEYSRDLGLLSEGKIGALSDKGYDVSGMRGTHHEGGLLGQMFGWGSDGDDVQTMGEIGSKLEKAGHVSVDPKTGQLVTTGLGPMNPLGFASSMVAPAVGQKAAEAVYGYTGDPTTAISAGNIASYGANVVGKDLQPSGLGGMGGAAATGLLGAVGVPGVGQLGQMVGSMQTAADLGYAGITAPSDAPVDSYTPNDQQYLFRRGYLA